jgi:hypothetical protein
MSALRRPRAPRWARLDDPRRRRTRVALLAALAGLLGVGVGLVVGPDPGAQAALRYQQQVSPLLAEVDSFWSTGRDGRAPLIEVLDGLRTGERTSSSEELLVTLDAHDTLLVRIVGVDLPAEARGAQRLAVVAVTLSRDAVEVLVRATSLAPGPARTDLVVEAARLRLRSEQIAITAGATAEELAGERRRLSPLPSLPTFGGVG